MAEIAELKMKFKKYFLILFSLLQNAFGINIPCENSGSCLDHQYCAASNLQCIDCFNCSYINREALKRCSKSFEDCGGCIDGFQEILLTDRAVHRKKPCQQKLLSFGRLEKACAEDVQCPDEQFCSGGLCRKCIDCKIYNRNPSSTCARTVDDCGSCFPGFLGLSKSSRLMPCIGSAAPLVNQSTAVQVNFSAMPFIVVLLCLSGAFLGFFIYRIRKQHCSADVVGIDSPPPYVASIVQCAENEDAVEQSVMCTSYKELGETENAARVFRLPNYMQPAASVQNITDVDNSSGLSHITPAASADTGTSIQAHDEDTMPCFWSPCYTEQSQADTTPLSFVGRLQPHTVHEEPEPSNSDPETDARPLKRQKVSA